MCTSSDQIRRANLDGSEVETIIAADVSFPADIELELEGGKIYWADRNLDWIRRANLDGSNVEVLISTGSGSNWGIDLDVAGGMMYWVDVNNVTVKRADLGGTGVQLVQYADRAWSNIACEREWHEHLREIIA